MPPRLTREGAEAVEQPADPVPHRFGTMAVAAGEFLVSDAFDLEPDQQVAFFDRQPSLPFAGVEKLLEKGFGKKWFLASRLL